MPDISISNVVFGGFSVVVTALCGVIVRLFWELIKQKDAESARLRKERDEAYDRLLSYDRTMQQTFPHTVPSWRGN